MLDDNQDHTLINQVLTGKVDQKAKQMTDNLHQKVESCSWIVVGLSIWSRSVIWLLFKFINDYWQQPTTIRKETIGPLLLLLDSFCNG